jgi:hypothetical protein
MGILVKAAQAIEDAIVTSPIVARRLLTGYYRLPKQSRLLAGDWSVLLILDACRSDYFNRVADPAAPVVRSLAACTRYWVRDFGALLAAQGIDDVLWMTANAVVDRVVRRYKLDSVRLISLWRERWEEIGEARIPSVRPEAVNEEVRAYLAAHGQPRRMIVQYIQPHAPYIGRRQLPLAKTGRGAGKFWEALKKMQSPQHAVGEGALTWDDVRDAYADNLALVWEAARSLAGDLKGKVVVTSDHGEVLGEDGRFGHDCSWPTEKLRRVPWLEFDNGGFSPTPVVGGEVVDADSVEMENRLRALGYM